MKGKNDINHACNYVVTKNCNYMREQNEKKIQKGSEVDKKEIHQCERKKGRVYEGVYEGGKRRKRRRNMICWK